MFTHIFVGETADLIRRFLENIERAIRKGRRVKPGRRLRPTTFVMHARTTREILMTDLLQEPLQWL